MKTYLALFSIWLLALIGWVMNIITLISMGDVPVTTMFIMRITGIFLPPLGAVLGWL